MINTENPESDTISVRSDEQIDVETLQTYLQGKLEGFDSDKTLQIRQFWGGAANLTYELQIGNYEYVLRRPPLGPVAKSAHDMSREYKVLSVLHNKYPYAPQAFHFCSDEKVLGAPFFIMERKHGTVIRTKFPTSYKTIPEAARKCSEALIDSLVDFHQVDYNELGLSDLGKPEGFIERQVDGWYRRWNKAKLNDNPQMDQIYKWLKDNIPKSSTHSIVHNDYKLDNVMFRNDNPSIVKAVFDWDMCTLGDPLSDLGALLTYWYQPDDPQYLKHVAMMPTDDLGFLTREELIHRYEERIGKQIDNINFYHSLGLFRLVVIIAQIYIRYVKGQTKDERFAGLNKVMPHIIRASYEVATGKFKQQ